jgi:hypothetical protein
VQRRPDWGLNGTAAASMLLLFVGIHNAWDIAVWMTLRRHEASTKAAPEQNKSD